MILHYEKGYKTSLIYYSSWNYVRYPHINESIDGRLEVKFERFL